MNWARFVRKATEFGKYVASMGLIAVEKSVSQQAGLSVNAVSIAKAGIHHAMEKYYTFEGMYDKALIHNMKSYKILQNEIQGFDRGLLFGGNNLYEFTNDTVGYLDEQDLGGVIIESYNDTYTPEQLSDTYYYESHLWNQSEHYEEEVVVEEEYVEEEQHDEEHYIFINGTNGEYSEEQIQYLRENLTEQGVSEETQDVLIETKTAQEHLSEYNWELDESIDNDIGY